MRRGVGLWSAGRRHKMKLHKGRRDDKKEVGNRNGREIGQWVCGRNVVKIVCILDC